MCVRSIRRLQMYIPRGIGQHHLKDAATAASVSNVESAKALESADMSFVNPMKQLADGEAASPAPASASSSEGAAAPALHAPKPKVRNG